MLSAGRRSIKYAAHPYGGEKVVACFDSTTTLTYDKLQRLADDALHALEEAERKRDEVLELSKYTTVSIYFFCYPAVTQFQVVETAREGLCSLDAVTIAEDARALVVT